MIDHIEQLYKSLQCQAVQPGRIVVKHLCPISEVELYTMYYVSFYTNLPCECVENDFPNAYEK